MKGTVVSGTRRQAPRLRELEVRSVLLLAAGFMVRPKVLLFPKGDFEPPFEKGARGIFFRGFGALKV